MLAKMNYLRRAFVHSSVPVPLSIRVPMRGFRGTFKNPYKHVPVEVTEQERV